MRKISKTKAKSAFTVNLTNANSAKSIYKKFGFAKHKAGLKVSNRELSCMLDSVVDATMAKMLGWMFYKSNGIILEGEDLLKVQLSSYDIKDDEMIVIKHGKVKIKKINIFKRFWNWLRGK